VFPFLKSLPDLKDEFEVQKYIKVKVRSINTYLKTIAIDLKISKKLTMHVSRHSFAQVSADKIPVQILQKLYRHSNITTTIGYQSNFSNKDMDDALTVVLS
jgi:site-specific recombinase XerD